MFEVGQRVKIVDIHNPDYNEVVNLEYYGTTFFIYTDDEDREWCCTVEGWEIILIDEEMIDKLQFDIIQAQHKATGPIAEYLYNMGWRKV